MLTYQHKEGELLKTKEQISTIQHSNNGYLLDKVQLKKYYQSSQIQSKFDLDNSLLCHNNYEIDRAMIMKDPIDPAVVVRAPPSVKTILNLFMDGVWLNQTVEMKPIGVFSKYYGTFDVSSNGSSINLEKKRGFERKEGALRTLNSYFEGLKGCDDTLDVTTKFNYTASSLVHPATDIPTSVQLDRGTYVYYQTATLYSCRFTFVDESIDPKSWIEYAEQCFRDYKENEGIRYRLSPSGDQIFVLFTVYRDQLIVKPYNENLRSPVVFDELIDYLFGKGYSRWMYNRK